MTMTELVFIANKAKRKMCEEDYCEVIVTLADLVDLPSNTALAGLIFMNNHLAHLEQVHDVNLVVLGEKKLVKHGEPTQVFCEVTHWSCLHRYHK